MRRSNRIVGMVAVLALVLSGCVSALESVETLPAGTPPEPDVVLAQGALVQFDACDAFLDYVIPHAVDLVGPYGFDGGPIALTGRRMEGEFEAAAEAGETDSADGSSFYSETNVQVEGVDEPDMVKTDRERIVVISEGELIVVDVTGDEPVETGRLPIQDFAVQSLFLEGDTVLLFGSSWSHGPLPLAERDSAIAPVGGSPTVQLIEVDITADPEIVRTMTIDGAFISGRMVDDTMRLVLTSGPVGFEWKYPSGSGLRAEREATEKNREIVRNSKAENWIPYYVVSDSEGDVVDEGILFDCDRAAHPEEFSGLDMLSVVTIDLGNGLDVIDATGVLAMGDTVYASRDSLYVATQNWDTWRWAANGSEQGRPEGPTTQIHKFDISEPRLTEYLASGGVDGYLLNQFAMDEHDGLLRVASTTTPTWWGSGPDSESRVTVLREIGGSLVRIGMVEGLGETEQIYSVRFIGETAYVVTFRQTDPLYTVDLSDPRRPKVVGELKIPGYSAYLHPVGDGLVMGVGQDSSDTGAVQGAQVSVFDVSDLSDPQRVDSYTLSEGTNSQVEYDHHAFLYWDGLAMIPVQQWWEGEKGEEVFIGAIALTVGEDGSLREVGRVVHPGGDRGWDWEAQILRSVVVDDSVYTISPQRHHEVQPRHPRGAGLARLLAT